MSDLLESLFMPYVFPDENAFALGIGSVIVGLLFFRFGLARRRQAKTIMPTTAAADGDPPLSLSFDAPPYIIRSIRLLIGVSST